MNQSTAQHRAGIIRRGYTALTSPAFSAYAIACLCFVLSFSKLSELAERVGYPGYAIWLFPVAIDFLALTAARGTQTLKRASARWYSLILLVLTTVVSVLGGAAITLYPPGPLPPIVAAVTVAIPPIIIPVAAHLGWLIGNDNPTASDATLRHRDTHLARDTSPVATSPSRDTTPATPTAATPTRQTPHDNHDTTPRVSPDTHTATLSQTPVAPVATPNRDTTPATTAPVARHDNTTKTHQDATQSHSARDTKTTSPATTDLRPFEKLDLETRIEIATLYYNEGRGLRGFRVSHYVTKETVQKILDDPETQQHITPATRDIVAA